MKGCAIGINKLPERGLFIFHESGGGFKMWGWVQNVGLQGFLGGCWMSSKGGH